MDSDTKKFVRKIAAVVWLLSFGSLCFAVYKNGDPALDIETHRSTSKFVQQLTPLLPPLTSDMSADKKYSLCLLVAVTNFGDSTTEQQRENVCRDYAYSTQDDAAQMLQAVFDEVAKVPVDKRGDWCLENAPYLFPEEKSIHVRCMLIVENWDSFWEEFKRSANKQVDTMFNPS